MRDLALTKVTRIRAFHLSYYEYVPQTLADSRTEIQVSASNFSDPEIIHEIIRSVPDGQELAFHSTVSLEDGGDMHIPLVDMSTGSAAQLEKLRPFLGEALFRAFKWYRSGRSFHGYAATLVNAKEWAALMGTLLLANKKGLAPTVDSRWVGHRLIAGYSSLRWTRNTSHYIELPSAVGAKRGE